MYKSAAVILDPKNIDAKLVDEAIHHVRRGGRLDVVFSNSPDSIEALEIIVSQLYSLAPLRPTDLDFIVSFPSTLSPSWEHICGHGHDVANLSPLREFGSVAVGGTWDHLHWGHRVLLTLAAATCKSKVIIGVTASELLVNKKFAEALEPYEMRVKAAESFVRQLRPDVYVETYPMSDIYGPTATVEDIQALIVSKETSSGGDLVNKKRAELGWNTLTIIEASLVGGASTKLSSTDLRREELEHERGEKH